MKNRLFKLFFFKFIIKDIKITNTLVIDIILLVSGKLKLFINK